MRQHHRMESVLCSGPVPVLVVLLLSSVVGVPLVAEPGDERSGSEAGKYAGYGTLVSNTHAASLKARRRVLREAVAKETCWPGGAWGDTMWALSALYLNRRVEEANERLLERAREFIAGKRGNGEEKPFKPRHRKSWPWAYFALTDYVRIVCLFRAGSEHFPGRLEPKTETAMKEALWQWVKGNSEVALASRDDLWLLLGTENHDLTRRTNHYLVAWLLKQDPAFRDRRYDDGHTAADHFDAYNEFFRAWPVERARAGLWIELGSNTYQKYSYPPLFNLHELAPDAKVRRRFGLLLDLAFIEEAQISVHGRRGGGRSRAEGGKHPFESYKNLLYAPEDGNARASHSMVIETSRYQLPPAAILLRKRALPPREPFVIRNRVPGELAPDRLIDDVDYENLNQFQADSALVNYAYRTPHYLLGSTLQNPALSMPALDTDKAVLKYGGISRQKRWCGMLFQQKSDEGVPGVYPVVKKTRGGRPQHPFWSVQHQNVLLLQRIPPQKHIGSYSTGKIHIRFDGANLNKVEKNGWIFASDGKAFVAVNFLDGDYEWDESRKRATHVGFQRFESTSRILMQAGDVRTHESFEQFRRTVLGNHLDVRQDRVTYVFGPDRTRIDARVYEPDHHKGFKLPRVDGRPIDLRPKMTYRSPYLRGVFGRDRIRVTVGPVQRTLDFVQ